MSGGEESGPTTRELSLSSRGSSGPRMLVLSSSFVCLNPVRQREWLIVGAAHLSVYAKWLEESLEVLVLRHSGPMLGTEAAKL